MRDDPIRGIAPRLLGRFSVAGTSTVLERGVRAYRSTSVLVLLSGLVEPVVLLAVFGYGVGQLVTNIPGQQEPIPYAAYVAPGLLAASVMNGAISDSTWGVFGRIKSRLYESMLSTSLRPVDVAVGEIATSISRAFIYAVGFLLIMLVFGLVRSPFALLAIPCVLLLAFAFSAVGLAVTSFLSRYVQVEIALFFVLPLFLFSGVLYPVEAYPPAIRSVVEALPMWHGVELLRAVLLDDGSNAAIEHLTYLTALSMAGLLVASLRLRRLFLR